MLGGQKQTLVNTVVSKMIADCIVLKDDDDQDFERAAHRINGVG